MKNILLKLLPILFFSERFNRGNSFIFEFRVYTYKSIKIKRTRVEFEFFFYKFQTSLTIASVFF